MRRSIARAVLCLVLAAGAIYLRPGDASAQQDMESMPGMSPTPTPPPAGEAAADVSAMPEMKPAGEPAKKEMSGMPGMESSGGSAKKPMGAMPGMAGETAAGPPRVAEPGVTVLGPHQKWAPPPGDDRSRELLSPAELQEHREPLPPPVRDRIIHSFTLAEILEYRLNSSGPDTFRWDIFGWVGGDKNRLWYKTEGSQQLSGGQSGEGDLQLLYGRLIAPNWDFQIGARAERSLGTGRADARTYAVIGLQGIAPYLFELEPSLFISDRGDVSARITVSFDLLLTQKLVLQPRFEGTAAIQSDEKMGVGEGVNETDLGLRLRYEIRREIAPYIGVSWLRQYGETARFAEREGDTTDSISFVAGLRLWW
ncbi:MAG: copper resistance protein B [Chthoniobacterales bacterium]|nr:copper resistance protein B [Chthoniobacterales bacterium]